MNVLTFTTLYPNSGQPNHGVFVENRLWRGIRGEDFDATVVAPIPWVPPRPCERSKHHKYLVAPVCETRRGIMVFHPRFLVVPKVGMELAPLLMYLGVRGYVRRLMESGLKVDLIDAHYFYPDGVAAALLARELRRPLIVTARGSDINQISNYVGPRKMMCWAARQAGAVVAVCEALKNRMLSVGMDTTPVEVIRNGVDLQVFRPMGGRSPRIQLGIQGPIVLSVGTLIRPKGHDLVIRCMPDLPGVHLLIVGQGPERETLKRLAESLGVCSRVRFIGAVPHCEMAGLYSMADILVLASEREGCANVLLESMACGTPVVATPVGGSPELVTCQAAGVLAQRSPNGLTAGIRELLTNPPKKEMTRQHAAGFGWDDVVRKQAALWERTVIGSATS